MAKIPAKGKAIPAKVQKAERAETEIMRRGKSHAQAERVEEKVLRGKQTFGKPKGKAQQREYPAPKRRAKH